MFHFSRVVLVWLHSFFSFPTLSYESEYEPAQLVSRMKKAVIVGVSDSTGSIEHSHDENEGHKIDFLGCHNGHSLYQMLYSGSTLVCSIFYWVQACTLL